MIDADSISFGYRAGTPVIRDWSLRVERGESVAITGPSGAGKSTLLYVLGTLVRPWTGTLRLGGSPVDALADQARSRLRGRLIGFVFQDALLDPRRSVIDNVVEGAIYRGADRRTAIRRGLHLLDALGVEVESGRRATDVSGGQAQRIALCRALLNEPQILLADEPTGNLDQANAEMVEGVILDWARAGGAVVVVTHDMALAGRCDQISALP